MGRSSSRILVCFLAVASGCAAENRIQPRHTEGFVYDDLGTHRRTVSTHSAEAQRMFDAGLVLTFAFDHDEAIRAFTRATEVDPSCASAWWGIALAYGPHINFPLMPPEKSAAAWDALEHARALEAGANETEHALIEALSARYANPPPGDRSHLDVAYAAAMHGVWREHPRDATIGTLYAESLMDLHPWDLWTNDGAPKPDTAEIVSVLEQVLSFAPDHPGANHLYIHAVEASKDPGRASAAADRLRTLVPGASHMVHMPSHIDARTGHYAAASAANERAIEVDRLHGERTGRTGFYRVYMAHNEQFLSFSSMMEGRSARALSAARAMVSGFPPELLEHMGPFVDGVLPITFHVLVRFGRWEEILSEPTFPDLFGVANVVRHYARGVALTTLDRFDEAQHELEELEALCAVMDDRPVGNNPAKTVIQIPQRVLRGELEFRRGNRDSGIALLREAVAIEDTLKYDEPPDWMMPVRHTLGAALVAAERFEEAEAVYREDLERWPENGWSLYGLMKSLAGRGKAADAAAVKARFEKAWSQADVALESSCFCQAPKLPAPR